MLILGICTWIIYILDRLLDNLKSEPEDARHQFHFQHQYYLQVVIIILFFIAAILAFSCPAMSFFISELLFGFNSDILLGILQKNQIS